MAVPTEYLVFKINILKKLLIATLFVSLSAFLIGQKGFSLGFIVGGLLAMAIFSLLYKYVLMLRNIELSKRKRFIVPRAFILIGIMAFALAIGIKKGVPVFLGTAMGVLLLKIVIFIQAFQEKHAGG